MKFRTAVINIVFLWLILAISHVKPQKRETIEKFNEILDIREEIRRFNIDRDLFFNGQMRVIPSIVRAGLSMTTSDVTVVLRFVTMLNVAR